MPDKPACVSVHVYMVCNDTVWEYTPSPIPGLKVRSVFIDTIGLGDPELSDEQIVFRTRKFINNCIKGINAVVVACRQNGPFVKK